jgi:hypothetical protein
MINMDGVGRYDANKKLLVAGYSSSPMWQQVISGIGDKTLQVQLDNTIDAPGDHEPFIRKNIPVLTFNTGTHPDFHKATDNADKLNYAGELQIAKYITRLIETTDNKGKLTFAKTPETVKMHKVNIRKFELSPLTPLASDLSGIL